MLTKVKMWWSELSLPAKIGVGIAVFVAMYAISAYNGVTTY